MDAVISTLHHSFGLLLPVCDSSVLAHGMTGNFLQDPVLAQLYVLNAQVLTIALEGGYGVLAEGVTGGLNADSVSHLHPELAIKTFND